MARSEPFGKFAYIVGLASIAVVVGSLYLAKGVLVPLILAVLASFLLSPVCDRLERWKLGRIPSVFATTLLAFALLGVVAWLAVFEISNLSPQMPEYEKNIQAKLHSTNDRLRGFMSKVTQAAEQKIETSSPPDKVAAAVPPENRLYSVRVVPTPDTPMQIITATFGTLLEALGSAGIVIVLVIFFLIKREDLRDRFIHLAGKGQVTLTTQAITDAGNRISRYLSVQILLNFTFGASVAVGLYFIGVPGAILWGMLGMVLRFVPYVGAWIAAAPAIGLSLAISTGWLPPILTLALFAGLDLFIGNVMEPWLYGKHTGISPVAVLVAAVFWTWLWGAVGLLLATPLTVCLMVLGKYVPQLAFLDILLGNEEVFEPKKRIYQRLLAGDQEEAAELIEGYLEKMSRVELYDTVLIPALAMAQAHWRLGEINEDSRKFIFESLKDTVEDLGNRPLEAPSAEATPAEEPAAAAAAPVVSPTPSGLRVLCLPARDAADELAGMMLGQLLAMKGCIVQAVSVSALASEMVDLVEQRQADVVCVSAMPPTAAAHACYLCKRLQGRFSEAHMIVGLWNRTGDMTKARQRIGCGPTTPVVGTLAAAEEKICGVLQPLLQNIGTQVQPPGGELAAAPAPK
jgi:predicted PurR-regulated permease PerM